MVSNRLNKIKDALSQAGCEFSKNGDTLQAQCPAHEDENPSLSITENGDGKILMKCHAGCDTKKVLSQLGLNIKVLFPDDSLKGGKNRIVATYDYTDEQGKLLYQAVRIHPKKFRQRQPKTGGGWKWSLKGVQRVIYNLPQVLDSVKKGNPVFLVEGEKDAQALIKRGLCATTAPMGAGKWKPQFNKYFKDVELIILPDNDQPGKQHAATAAGELLSKAKSIRVMMLPGLNIKGDVSDWLASGGTKQDLLELAFESDLISSETGAEVLLGIDADLDENDPRYVKDQFFEDNLKIYSNDKEERVVADFNISIKSVVKDDRKGQIFYAKIIELDRGRRRISDTIEIKPECLDNLRSFYKAIRPYSMGEIMQYRSYKTKPLNIFKWLLQNFGKPVARRPDHIGFIKGPHGRPFWIFGNAVICPPWKSNEAKIVPPNEADEFIINDSLGFTLPLYESNLEKEQLVPTIKTDLSAIELFISEVQTKLLQLIGGGDPSGRARNYGKLLLAYVIYHLYEKDLYYANDINGHTVMFYVFGPKGTGKTTYFNTVLQAFFGLHRTQQNKGNNVSVPGLENTMTMYSQLPVCYDEYNPEAADIKYQDINGYYHKTARSVNDNDRKNRNKFVNIRSTFSITSNYRVNLDVDQADTTQSRTIYFEYKKQYRSDDDDLFEWMGQNLNRLSAVTTYWLLNQTDKKRDAVKAKAKKMFSALKRRLEAKFDQHPKKYAPEHRLTDNYTRLLACYELVFGKDKDLRQFTEDELLKRFAAAKTDQRENKLLNQLVFLASSGRLKECWHYHYSNSQKKLYVNINQCYQTYESDKRDKAISVAQFREILQDYFNDCGGFKTDSPRWYGKYYTNQGPIEVNKTKHSHILTYDQVSQPENLLTDLFPPKDKHQKILRRMNQNDNSQQINAQEEAAF